MSFLGSERRRFCLPDSPPVVRGSIDLELPEFGAWDLISEITRELADHVLAILGWIRHILRSGE
jgi:hypothetical protein